MLLPLALLVVSAAPSAASATKLARAKNWDELYLAFAAAKSADASAKDRDVIAKALAEGCLALEGADAVMAFSLGEKSVEFAPTANGLLCAGTSARHANQPDAAERLLKDGASRFGKDSRFHLELARLYQQENDVENALVAVAAIPAKAKEFAEAQKLRASLHTSDAPSESPGHVRVGGSSGSTTGLSYESSVDDEGRRVRSNAYFRFRYFNGKRDFGQRADYEGSVQEAMNTARTTAQRLLGTAREQPLDIILYSREEFRMHHGAGAARAVAGFYSENAIRMNDSAEMNERNQLTLVHEYVHAVIDELSGFHSENIPIWVNEGLAEYTEWRAEGLEGPPPPAAKALRDYAERKQLPSISAMSQGPLIAQRNPALAYALSACAVKLMIQRANMSRVLDLLRDVGSGQDFAKAFERTTGTDLERFEAELTAELASK